MSGHVQDDPAPPDGWPYRDRAQPAPAPGFGPPAGYPAAYPAPNYPPYGHPGYGQPPNTHPGHWHAPYAYPPPHAVAPKSPGLALLASWFLPGLGSLMNGDVGTGIVIMLGYFVAIALISSIIFLIVGFPLALGLWIWGVVDAYSGARRWNARHGILS